MNILFTNAGRRTYIIDYALQLKGIKIFVTETDKYSPVAMYDRVHKFSTIKVSDSPKKYLKQIFNIVKRENIKKVIPLSDFDLIILAKNKKFFFKNGCNVIISDVNIVKKCINKKLMYQHCVKNQINTPESFFSKNARLKKNQIFLKKKIEGSGGEGMEILKKKSDISKINFKNFFIQKKIKGEEYGADIFSMQKNNFRICIKKKILMRSGETDRSVIVADKKIFNFCKKIKEYFPTHGNLDCDIIKDKNGRLYLIDLNPRFGGGYPATHEAGFKFLYFLLKKKFKVPKMPVKKIVSKGINILSKKIK